MRRYLLLVSAVLLALLTGTVVTGSASASSALVGADAGDQDRAPTMVAFAAMRYVAPGRTTTISVGYYEDMYTFKKVSGARFTSSNRQVLRVSSVGTVTGVARGNATVRVSIAGTQLTVPIGVRHRILWSTTARTSPGSNGESRILHGVGFTPGSEVQFTTNAVAGVFVTPSAAVDTQGTFSGTLYSDGYVDSGPFLMVDYSGGSSPSACPSAATWVVTATDVRGATRTISGTCP
jgi:hypothetical protein